MKDESALDEIRGDAPALERAQRLSRAAAEVGFDWSDWRGVLDKLDEERAELREALAGGDQSAWDPDALAHELGDLLFTVVNLCRHLGADAEAALRGTSDRFERRFRRMEADIRAAGDRLADLDEDTLEARWQAAKREVG